MYKEELDRFNNLKERAELACKSGCVGLRADTELLEIAFHAMQQRLEEQREKGYSGWNDTSPYTDNMLQMKLGKCFLENDWVDMMNLAAMLFVRGLGNAGE